MKRLIVLISLILSAACARAGERLVYSVAQEDAGRFPRLVKTEIFAVELDGGNKTLLFSDAGTTIILLPVRRAGGIPEQVMVSASGRVFARGVERSRYPGGWYDKPASIYELTINGTNAFRKVFDIQGEQDLRNLFVDSAATKVGYLNMIGAKWYIFVHDAATGTLLHKKDTSSIFLDCFARNIGYLPDGQMLFFTLETGDVHVTSQASYKRVGSYAMKDSAATPARIPVPSWQKAGYTLDTSLPPMMIGALPDGRYLFREYLWKREPRSHSPAVFLSAIDTATKSHKNFPVSASEGLFWFRLSGSGRYLAFSEIKGQTELERIWILDLVSGAEREIFSFPTKSLRAPYLGLIGWIGN